MTLQDCPAFLFCQTCGEIFGLGAGAGCGLIFVIEPVQLFGRPDLPYGAEYGEAPPMRRRSPGNVRFRSS
jgi:hypothetical protein